MNRMAAAHRRAGFARVKEELHADRTVSMHSILDAGVGPVRAIACATLFAVSEILAPADTAYAASIAVKLFLRVVIVEKSARQATVFAEANAAGSAVFSHWLPIVAEQADYLSDGMPVHFVHSFRIVTVVHVLVVVTEAAHELLPTARGNEGAAAAVVLAAI